MTPLSSLIARRDRFHAPERTVLPSRYANILHAYQALPAWNADGSKLLYAGFENETCCDIVIRDMASGKEEAIAQTDGFNQHCAAWQQWALGGTAVLFRGQESGSCPFLVHLDGSGIEPVTDLSYCHIRHVNRRGNEVVFLRLPGEGKPFSEMGVYDLQTRRVTFSMSIEEAVDGLLHGARPQPEQPAFDHTVANPDGTRIFFKMSTADDTGSYRAERSFHAIDLKSRRQTDFGPDILGHPAWIDNRYIANIQKTRDGADNRYLVAMDAETGEVHRLHDLPIPGAGHPAPSPDGRWIATDSFTADGRWSILYLLDLRTGEIHEIDRIDHRTELQTRYNPFVITRAHPHPTWSPNSQTVLANCNFGGTRLGLITWTLSCGG